ncbi:MAG: DUF4845 domain-containing protein [Rhodocyclaceae bacterium]
MNRQCGVALSGLLMWCIVIFFVAVLGMKVGPEYLNYFNILKAVKSVAATSSGKTVAEIRTAYSKQADVGYIKSLQATDLDISKEGNEVVIAFAYESRIPLFHNISLLIDFQGSSSGSNKGE